MSVDKKKGGTQPPSMACSPRISNRGSKPKLTLSNSQTSMLTKQPSIKKIVGSKGLPKNVHFASSLDSRTPPKVPQTNQLNQIQSSVKLNVLAGLLNNKGDQEKKHDGSKKVSSKKVMSNNIYSSKNTPKKKSSKEVAIKKKSSKNLTQAVPSQAIKKYSSAQRVSYIPKATMPTFGTSLQEETPLEETKEEQEDNISQVKSESCSISIMSNSEEEVDQVPDLLQLQQNIQKNIQAQLQQNLLKLLLSNSQVSEPQPKPSSSKKRQLKKSETA